MKNEPRKIFLNVGEEATRHDDFKELAEVTWCDEEINDLDIQYIHFKDLRGLLISVNSNLLKVRTHGLEIDKSKSEEIDEQILSIAKVLKTIIDNEVF